MARKQSSTIWFDGKKHKEIYFNGHYHDKMYLTDSQGNPSLVWEKLSDGTYVSVVDLFRVCQYHNGYTYGLLDYILNRKKYTVGFTYTDNQPTSLSQTRKVWRFMTENKLFDQKWIGDKLERLNLDYPVWTESNGYDFVMFVTESISSYTDNQKLKPLNEYIRQYSTEDFSYKQGKDMELKYPIALGYKDSGGSASSHGIGREVVYNNTIFKYEYDQSTRSYCIMKRDFDGKIISKYYPKPDTVTEPNGNLKFFTCKDKIFAIDRLRIFLFDETDLTELFVIEDDAQMISIKAMYTEDCTYLLVAIETIGSSDLKILGLKISGIYVESHFLFNYNYRLALPTMAFTQKDENGKIKIVVICSEIMTYDENFNLIKKQQNQSGYGGVYREFVALSDNVLTGPFTINAYEETPYYAEAIFK